MTPRALRWATGGVAALSIALLLGGLPLAYLGRHSALVVLWPAATVVAGAALVTRFARSSGEERLQLKWFAHGHSLRFTVSDDGAGYDASRTPMGSGQRNMADRLAALDGRLEVRSVPSKGTTITAHLPLPAGPAES